VDSGLTAEWLSLHREAVQQQQAPELVRMRSLAFRHVRIEACSHFSPVPVFMHDSSSFDSCLIFSVRNRIRFLSHKQKQTNSHKQNQTSSLCTYTAHTLHAPFHVLLRELAIAHVLK
jgi:hypothetical protein